MGAMSIEQSETRVEASSYDLPVAEHVEIYWTPYSMLYVWCFNGNRILHSTFGDAQGIH